MCNNNYDSFSILSACTFDCTLGAGVLYNMTVCSSYCSFCCTGFIKYTGAIEKAEICRKFQISGSELLSSIQWTGFKMG